MTDPKRFAVPLEQLDGVRVGADEQVQEQALDSSPDAGTWNGGLQVPAHGGGGGHVEGDGD